MNKKIKDREFDFNGVWINGDLKSFNPRQLIENSLKRGNLHSNRYTIWTENKKVVYTIFSDPYDFNNKSGGLWIDIIKTTYTRPYGYDNDDIRAYKMEKKQERIMNKEFKSVDEAVRMLEQFKNSTHDSKVKKVKDELTGNWRREFIEKFTKELQKSPYSYSLKEANDIAMKRADNERNGRFSSVDAMVRHNLSNTLTKAQYEKEYNDSKVKDETIKTPRGTFVLTEKTEQELKNEGYGYHHSSEDGRYKIYVKNNQAVAVRTSDSKVKDTYVWGKKNGTWTVIGGCFWDGHEKVLEKFKNGEIYQGYEDIRINRDNKKPKDSLKLFKVNNKVVKAKDEFDAINKYRKVRDAYDIREGAIFKVDATDKYNGAKYIKLAKAYNDGTFLVSYLSYDPDYNSNNHIRQYYQEMKNKNDIVNMLKRFNYRQVNSFNDSKKDEKLKEITINIDKLKTNANGDVQFPKNQFKSPSIEKVIEKKASQNYPGKYVALCKINNNNFDYMVASNYDNNKQIPSEKTWHKTEAEARKQYNNIK